MIKYIVFETMKKKGISQNQLIKKYNFSHGTLDRIRKNEPLSTKTIDDLCNWLDCKVEEVLVHEKEDI